MSIEDGVQDGLVLPAERPLWPYLVVGNDPRPRAWLSAYDAVLKVLVRIAEAIAVLAFLLMFAIVTYGVFCRYFLNSPLTWAETIAIWSVVWMVFVGAAAPTASSTQYVVEAFIVKLPPGVQMATALVIHTLVILFCAVVVREGTWLAIQNLHQIAPAPTVPYAYSYAAVPIGFGLMGLILLRDWLVLVARIARGQSL
jgi:TRAP-type C4-dicarboxylate transport system permease small subunit